MPAAVASAQPAERPVPDSTYVVWDSAAPEADADAATRPRVYDLLHTRAELSVYFDPGSLSGTVTHTLRPLFDSTSVLPFDAEHLVVEHVTRIRRGQEGTVQDTLAYTHEGALLEIGTGTLLGRADTVVVRIAYRTEVPATALFSTNRDGTPQLWTAGEGGGVRAWLPTWDTPGDVATSELLVTVPETHETAAVGELSLQLPLGDGLRQDHWTLARPFPTYQLALVVGDYLVRQVDYNRPDGSSVPVAYYVQPGFAGAADRLYGDTRSILAFVEGWTGVRYPWPTFKLVPVPDPARVVRYVPTLSVLPAAYQEEAAPSADGTGWTLEREVARAWLGSYVSPRDASQSAVLEGLAGWLAGRYRGDDPDGGLAWQREQWLARYLEEAETYRRPLIGSGGTPSEALVDAHTLAKAPLVVDYLRFLVGDEPFQRGVTRFLRTHRYAPAALGDLQAALEAEHGESLRAPFAQWWQTPGHPELRVTQGMDAKGVYTVRVEQTHDIGRTALFDFEADIEMNYLGIVPFVQRVRIHTRDTTFAFAGSAPVSFVRFDPEDRLPAAITVEKPREEWIDQLRKDDALGGRLDAVAALAPMPTAIELRDLFVNRAEDDPSPHVRAAAAAALQPYADEGYVLQALERIWREEHNETVRANVAWAMGGSTRPQGLALVQDALEASSPEVRAAAVKALALQRRAEALPRIESFLTSPRPEGATAAIEALAIVADSASAVLLVQTLAGPQGGEYTDAVLDAAERIARRPGGPALADALVALLASEDEAVRFRAALALARTAPPSATAAVHAHLATEPSGRVQAVLEEVFGTPAGAAAEGPSPEAGQAAGDGRR